MAHYSFAMANAADSIKAIARYQTDDNNHQGALNVIQAVPTTPHRLTKAITNPESVPGFYIPIRNPPAQRERGQKQCIAR